MGQAAVPAVLDPEVISSDNTSEGLKALLPLIKACYIPNDLRPRYHQQAQKHSKAAVVGAPITTCHIRGLLAAGDQS